MVNKEQFEVGHKKCKKMDGGIHENMQLLRQALNELCEQEQVELPESLVKLNEVFK